MPVTFEQVVSHLDREEPNYAQAARLGPEALPHLMRLVEENDPELASGAAYLAGLIDGEQSLAVVEKAARSPHSEVRVAAASALGLLHEPPVSLFIHLLDDDYIGTRKYALKSLKSHSPIGVRAKVEDIANNDPDVGLRQLANQIINVVR